MHLNTLKIWKFYKEVKVKFEVIAGFIVHCLLLVLNTSYAIQAQHGMKHLWEDFRNAKTAHV